MSHRIEQQGHHRLGAKAMLVVALAMLFVAQAANACPVCYGAPGDPMVKSANNGVWVLLGVVFFVQAGFASFFWSFRRRAREQRRELPGTAGEGRGR